MISWIVFIPFAILANVEIFAAAVIQSAHNENHLQSFLEGRTNIISSDDRRSVCDTNECLDFARTIEANLNASVDPCVDFYEFACGRQSYNNATSNLRSVVQKEIQRQIEEILTSVPQSNDIPAVKLVKRWYRACMNTNDMEARGVDPITEVLEKIGGWPLLMELNEWDGTRYTWQNVDDFYAGMTGKNSLHELRVAAYGKNVTEKTAIIDLPDMPPGTWVLSEEAYENQDGNNEDNDEIVLNRNEKYFKFVLKVANDVARASGYSVMRERLLKDVEDMLKFQLKLNKLTLLMDDYANSTLDGFQNWYDGLNPVTSRAKTNWTEKVRSMFQLAEVYMDGDLNVKIISPEYFTKLIPLLDATPNRVIVNYLHWNFISTMLTSTTKELKILYNNVTSADEDEETHESRSENCIGQMKMNDIVSYEYVRKHYSDDTTNNILGMFSNIEEIVKKQIEESNWMDSITKLRALTKLTNIKKLIGYPSWYKNSTVMNEYFDGLTLYADYFTNVIIYKRHTKLKELRALIEENDAKEWLVSPTTINAFYMAGDNSITLPAANLRKPFFSTAQPDTINYALLGFLMSHEINHAFDDARHQYDETGETVTWSPRMSIRYKKRVQCFINQFNNYTFDGSSTEALEGYGDRNIDENMADTLGLRAAFKAYRRKQRLNGRPEKVLPGLEKFSNDQLFFLSFANLWCEAIKPEDRLIWAKLKSHSTGRLRTIGAISNSEEFAEAFNCPSDAPMNPDQKCYLWK